MNEPLGLAHFFSNADGVALFVLGLMAIASIGTWYLIVTKGLAAWRERRASARFLAAFWDAPDLAAVAGRIRQDGTSEPFSHLLHHGFSAIEHLDRSRGQASSLIEAGAPDDMLTRALKRAIEEDKSRLEFGQTFLATVASAAPFIGLFGTVWGIYHALIAIGLSGQGSLDKVAGPVGEALVMTGLGLAVAIPAAIAYNAFARANRNTLTELNSFAYDVFTFLATGIKSSPTLNDVRATSDKVIALARAMEAADPAHPGLNVR